ncbi:MAG: hypothetical protein J3Q66DRAFT_360226, partial [Benniella sp.]
MKGCRPRSRRWRKSRPEYGGIPGRGEAAVGGGGGYSKQKSKFFLFFLPMNRPLFFARCRQAGEEEEEEEVGEGGGREGVAKGEKRGRVESREGGGATKGKKKASQQRNMYKRVGGWMFASVRVVLTMYAAAGVCLSFFFCQALWWRTAMIVKPALLSLGGG